MYLIVHYYITIDVHDAIRFYSDARVNALNELRRRFDGICYDGKLILRVLRIANIGECVFSTPTDATLGSLSVSFWALVTVYCVGDIIAGVTARRLGDEKHPLILAPHANALEITTPGREKIPVVRDVDNLVPIRVCEVTAKPGLSSIMLFGEIIPPSSAYRCYPMVHDGNDNHALDRAIYAPLSGIAQIFTKFGIAMSTMDVRAIPSEGMTIANALKDARVVWDDFKERSDARAIADALLLMGERDTAIPDVIKIVDCTMIPVNATCIIEGPGISLFDGTVGVTFENKWELPIEWVVDAEMNFRYASAKCMERRIDAIVAAMTIINELANDKRVEATSGLIKYWRGV